MSQPAAYQVSSGSYSWAGRRVLVTGGAGFVGSYLVEDLLRQGANVRVVDDFSSGAPDELPATADVEFLSGDLRDPEVARRAVAGVDVVMHLAARAYGMLRSMENSPEILRDNCMMSFHVLDACVAAGVERALMVSSSCVYPDDAPVPTPELPVHQGLPESVNEGYGWGKRMLEIQSRYVHEKHGLPIAIVRPFNAYGGRYRWQGTASHVVPSLVKKVLDRSGPVVVWGSGRQARDLLHARDFALGFRLATECAVDCDPINLGCGSAVKLVEIVEKVAELAGIEVEVEFDRAKPDGRPCKQADVTKLRRRLPGFRQTVTLEQGLAEMIEWYERARRSGAFDDPPSPARSPLPAQSPLPAAGGSSAPAPTPDPAPSPA
jgi:nucleoside-diphosphate-sugar epimerase